MPISPEHQNRYSADCSEFTDSVKVLHRLALRTSERGAAVRTVAMTSPHACRACTSALHCSNDVPARKRP